MKLRVFLLCLIVFLSACHREKISQPLVRPSVIPKSRIMVLEVKCHTFHGSVSKRRLAVLDVTVPSVKKIFKELFKNKFPIYAVAGYADRNIVNGRKPSLHAYGAAIDINEHINPYLNVITGMSSVEPRRFINREQDERGLRTYLMKRKVVEQKELDATLASIIQSKGSDDWFINREIYRKGMISPKEVEIFARHGFIIWGGKWRQPMDFMHFQIPRKLAEHLAALSKERGKRVWRNHVLITQWHLKLLKKLGKVNTKRKEKILADHLVKCRQDDDYLSAANSRKTTAVCINDCRRKLNGLQKVQNIANKKIR